MRKVLAMLAVATLHFGTQALAVASYGVLTGLSLDWNAAGNPFLCTRRRIRGRKRSFWNVLFTSFANLQNGQAITANFPYYVHACWDTTTVAWSPSRDLHHRSPMSGYYTAASGRDRDLKVNHPCDALFLSPSDRLDCDLGPIHPDGRGGHTEHREQHLRKHSFRRWRKSGRQLRKAPR